MRTKLIAPILKVAGIATAALVLATVTASPAAAMGSHHWRHAIKGRNGVPEIDPGTAGSALSLALGGIAMLADRRRKR